MGNKGANSGKSGVNNRTANEVIEIENETTALKAAKQADHELYELEYARDRKRKLWKR